jgi:hypothetical protein
MNATKKNDKVRHIMTQIASLLAIATALLPYGLLISTFYNQSRGDYRRDKTTQKYRGGLYARGGVFAGFYSNIIIIIIRVNIVCHG